MAMSGSGSRIAITRSSSGWTSGDCKWRVIRGGSWNNLPQDVRAAIRDNIAPDYRYNYLGFRVARTLSP
jgi:formylglycine-generating enzyme required for sulfatase activity